MKINKRFLMVGAFIVGAALPFYLGLMWLFPLIPTVAIWWGGQKLLAKQYHLFLPVLAVQSGQMLWYISASIFMHSLAPVDILEATVILGLAIWLLVKPGTGSALAVGVVLVLSLAMNLLAFSEAVVGSIPHKALTVHAIWRVAALLLLWEGYVVLQKTFKVEEPAPAT